MRSKVSVGEYLAFLSIKYEVDPDKLFYAIVSASENHESTCDGLSIKCRGKQRGKTVLLISNGSKVVAQFPISEDFLSEQNNPIKSLRKTEMCRRHLNKQNKEPRSICIRDLKIGMKQVNLNAKVIEISKPTLVFTRFGNYASVANALIADETGTIKLCLWNEQINSVSVGDTVQVENARLSMFKGERQLRIGKNGRLALKENIDLHCE